MYYSPKQKPILGSIFGFEVGVTPKKPTYDLVITRLFV